MGQKGKDLLESAYRLETPVDNVEFYRDFSDTYDDVFVDALGFALPSYVADCFLKRRINRGPIADLGCGTGKVGYELRDHSLVVDGLDISIDMLAKAKALDVYRDLIEIDLTAKLPKTLPLYDAVLSSGTFTHGHLGPEVLDNVLKLGKSKCLFVLSINMAHYSDKGFEAALNQFLHQSHIEDIELTDVPIYRKSGHAHSNDRALIASFFKT